MHTMKMLLKLRFAAALKMLSIILIVDDACAQEHRNSVIHKEAKVQKQISCDNEVLPNAKGVSATGKPVVICPSSPKLTDMHNVSTQLIKIDKFITTGDKLLGTAEIERVLLPFTGANKSLADILLAVKSLKKAYQKAGFSAVSINAPEQEIKNGIVVLAVTEPVIEKITISGNKYHDAKNIRSALPALIEGYPPNIHKLSENIRLANQNASRQLSVVLTTNKQNGQIDTQVDVTDSSPHQVFMTLDNFGTSKTGIYRTGISYQHNNLYNNDQSATFNYVTSPGHVGQVTQISASYRIPLYTWGATVDMIAAYTDTNIGVANTVAGLLSFRGKGTVFGAYYNHYLPRQNDYSSKVTAGFDHRAYVNNCSLGIFGAVACGPSATSITVRPISVAYNGTWTKSQYIADYAIKLVHNIAGGASGGSSSFNALRPSPVGGAGAKTNYNIVRANSSLTGTLPQKWQYRLAGHLQYTSSALIYAESFGLVGENAVRGFPERTLSSDKGYVLNMELYTPELSPTFGFDNSHLKLLSFIDHAEGWRVPLEGEAAMSFSAASIGVGVRFNYGKNITTKFDLTRIIDDSSAANIGRERIQFSAIIRM